jgi:hypothetical protein
MASEGAGAFALFGSAFSAGGADLIKADGRVYGDGMLKTEPKGLARIPVELVAGLTSLADFAGRLCQESLF